MKSKFLCRNEKWILKILKINDQLVGSEYDYLAHNWDKNFHHAKNENYNFRNVKIYEDVLPFCILHLTMLNYFFLPKIPCANDTYYD